MKTRLSTLLDDELERADVQHVCADLKRSKELRLERDMFFLIGDSLRSEGQLHIDMTDRIMAALEKEPVVLAPRKSIWQRHVYAAAASVAGVAVVGVVAFSMYRQDATSLPHGAQVAQLSAVPAVAAKGVSKQVSRDMQEYLIAHQAQSAGFNLGGGSSQQIRTVSLVAAGGER